MLEMEREMRPHLAIYTKWSIWTLMTEEMRIRVDLPRPVWGKIKMLATAEGISAQAKAGQILTNYVGGIENGKGNFDG